MVLLGWQHACTQYLLAAYSFTLAEVQSAACMAARVSGGTGGIMPSQVVCH